MRYTKNVFVLFVILLGWSRLFAQTYHLGDIYEAPDGSQGIVYYLNPDGSGGLVVALHDASAGCSWGELVDIPSLQSYIRSDSYNTPVHVLMTDTSGYTNTIIIRAFQNNNPSFAAGVVDIANGWVLPSLEQLAKLFGQLPFISAALVNAGGEEPAYSRYWCSAECDSTRAWVVNFENSYSAGNFLAMNKANIYRVRAVRSFSYKEPQPELSYTWSTGDTTTSITVTPDQTTTYTVTVSTPGGCADTVGHTITVLPVDSVTISVDTCDFYWWGDEQLTESGTYTRTLTNAAGCDSMVTLELTLNQSVGNYEERIVCENELPYQWDGMTFDDAGEQSVSLQAENGCDSVVTRFLIVRYSTHNVETETSCGSYDWHGMTCDTSGTYTYSYTNGDGCPSVDTLHLTVNHGTHNVETETACENYTWNGVTYYESGSYTQTFTAANGCDSVVTLQLTLVNPPEVTITATDDTVCEGERVRLYAHLDNPVGVDPVSIGDILCTDGSLVKPSAWPVPGKTALGVVFYVDNTGEHGWAVHLQDQGENIQWCSQSSSDVSSLTNINTARNALMDLDGYSNTMKIRSEGNASMYPAAWLVDFANGWYLPAMGQLRLLVAELSLVNPSLEMTGGSPILTDPCPYYWSSTERNYTYAWCLLSCYQTLTNGMKDFNMGYPQYSVRSVRNF